MKLRSVCVSIRSGLVIAAAAVGILGAGISAPASAQTAACTGGGKISKQIAKPMIAAQEAQRAKKWQDVLSRVRDAENTPGNKSQFDLYYMAETRGYAYHNLKQDADAARELETALNSPCMPEAKKVERYKTLVGLYTALKQYPKVIDYANRGLKLAQDPDLQVALAQAYYLSGNNKESVRVMSDLLSKLEAKGSTPKEQQLLLIVAACQRAEDNGCVAKVYEKLVVYYPKPDYWLNLLVALKNSDTDDIQKLNVMRLSVHVKTLKKPEDFKEMAQLTLERKLACESQSVLELGFANKVFVEKRDVDVNTRLLNAAKAEAEKEKAALAQNDAASRSAATGDASVQLGAQYLGCGDAAKAVEALQRGISKGSIAKGDPKEAEKVDEASMQLGIAYLRANNKAEAAKAFKAVKRDPTMVRIAKLWLLNT
jgi:tetratricopeptide (TPR) repeat protein